MRREEDAHIKTFTVQILTRERRLQKADAIPKLPRALFTPRIHCKISYVIYINFITQLKIMK